MSLEPVPLESVNLKQLEALLGEETQRYADWYRWDFSGTAKLVRQLVSTHRLGGMALLDGEQAVGYSYYVIEDQKALIGDAYVMDAHATAEAERLLMATSIEAVRSHPQVRRVESQPMMLRFAYSHPRAERHERLFLELDLNETRWPQDVVLPVGYRLEAWNWRLQDEAAQILVRAYRNHLDAEMNDQYRSPGRARSYMNNMVSYPACGAFSPEASFFIQDKETGGYVGVVCACLAGPVGHIAQLCVEPGAQKKGLGRLLLAAALSQFTDRGCEHSTLTVTTENRHGVRLYESLGYRERARLSAYVWPLWPF